MAKTANINVRIDPETKSMAENLFSSFGITITDAINIFLRKSIMEGGLPFEMKQPHYNVQTEAAMKEARDIMEGRIQVKSYSSARSLFEELDSEEDDTRC
ncbi:MAG TPA: type II toxin-antitoxin system antitoxin, RelB/DinJ family [Lachnospiraceae bacterium]|nr:type II toxin-antitoxin system antitoxin, RelB/DinJ family [Lachnospiraceae bacterium]